MNTSTPTPRKSLILEEAQRQLESCSHFKGRCGSLQLDWQEPALIVRGSLPSFYLKQVMHGLLQRVQGVRRIVDEVDVICCDGLSGR